VAFQYEPVRFQATTVWPPATVPLAKEPASSSMNYGPPYGGADPQPAPNTTNLTRPADVDTRAQTSGYVHSCRASVPLNRGHHGRAAGRSTRQKV